MTANTKMNLVIMKKNGFIIRILVLFIRHKSIKYWGNISYCWFIILISCSQ